ncbi:MarR family winged helix-turn-helix transcriptional regulator [Cupriavidus consociatus]|uniref:MarR family winged helix-turn-helix transcriptional regulator n=1 Tax=Cupriavidus consociatus TaxID=2821357 RepID=UPI001AE7F21F|nr:MULTISPECIES: MarR family winged helix-turn-helix transcriptional regulator [unclassified Cupriavidus]MBP0619527.1 winged helix-turn-helix transcriptional regulator [Cupriavidus sp. LEh25]MDK2656175.1 MarR family winged helix-turn-helix transcriptional regulator [Cupriavidus sp. LEh21]
MAYDDGGSRLQRPRRLGDFINYRVYHLNRVALGAAGLHLRATAGVTRREWRMIAFLGEQPGTRLTELAQSAGLDKVLASRAVHALVERGLVRREARAQDRRAAAFTLTEEGEAVYHRAFAQARAFNRELAACLSAEEARVLSRCLDKLQARAEAMMAEAQALPQPEGAAPPWDPLQVWRGGKG